MIAKPTFRNGHHITKAEGETKWNGPLEHLPPPTPITSAEEAAERMYTDGCVQFPDLLSADEVRELRAWMDASGGPDEQYDMKNWCFNKHLPARPHQEPQWLSLMDRSPAFEVLERILGEGFVFVNGSLWITGRGRAMGLHVDHQAVSLPEDVLADPRVRVPIMTATLHFYLDDQVEEIGPTLLVPGSHRAGRHPVNENTWNGQPPRMISVKAGGAVLFRHDLWHGAAMNRSDRRRYLIQAHYAEGSRRLSYPGLDQAEKWNPAVLAQATPRQRRLLGEKARSIFY